MIAMARKVQEEQDNLEFLKDDQNKLKKDKLLELRFYKNQRIKDHNQIQQVNKMMEEAESDRAENYHCHKIYQKHIKKLRMRLNPPVKKVPVDL